MSITTIIGSSVVRRRDARTGIVIELASEGVYVRERGRKLKYGPIAYGKILLVGAHQFVAEQKRLKAEKRARDRAERRIR